MKYPTFRNPGALYITSRPLMQQLLHWIPCRLQSFHDSAALDGTQTYKDMVAPVMPNPAMDPWSRMRYIFIIIQCFGGDKNRCNIDSYIVERSTFWFRNPVPGARKLSLDRISPNRALSTPQDVRKW